MTEPTYGPPSRRVCRRITAESLNRRLIFLSVQDSVRDTFKPSFFQDEIARRHPALAAEERRKLAYVAEPGEPRRLADAVLSPQKLLGAGEPQVGYVLSRRFTVSGGEIPAEVSLADSRRRREIPDAEIRRVVVLVYLRNHPREAIPAPVRNAPPVAAAANLGEDTIGD